MKENSPEEPLKMSSIERKCSACEQVVEIHGPEYALEKEGSEAVSGNGFVCKGCQMEKAGITAKIASQEKNRRSALTGKEDAD